MEEMINACRNLDWKPQGEIPFGELCVIKRKILKIIIIKTECEGVDWIDCMCEYLV
jgi:hypothetical protein